MRLKIKKRKQKIKIKTTKAKRKRNKRFSPGWDSWKARIISTRLLYHMAITDLLNICAISVHRMGDQELKHITISSQINFFKSVKRSRKSKCQENES